MDDLALLRQRVTEVFENSNINSRIRLRFAEDGTSWLVTVGKSVEAIEATNEGDARTEFKATLPNALAVFNRKLSPARAMMTLKLKISGDLGLALTVTELLKKPIPASAM